MKQLPWLLTGGGVSLAVRLTPRGGRDSIDGIDLLDDGRAVLKVRVRVAPSDGEANAVLTRLVAQALGVPPRDVTLAAGVTSRIKRLMISGNGSMLIAALEKTCAPR